MQMPLEPATMQSFVVYTSFGCLGEQYRGIRALLLFTYGVQPRRFDSFFFQGEEADFICLVIASLVFGASVCFFSPRMNIEVME